MSVAMAAMAGQDRDGTLTDAAGNPSRHTATTNTVHLPASSSAPIISSISWSPASKATGKDPV